MPGPKSPFTAAQEQEIIFCFGELKSATLVRRWFCKQYPNIPHYNVPQARQFVRIIERFKRSNSTQHAKPPG